MPVAEIPVALAWAHPLVAEWFLGEVWLSDRAAGARLARNSGWTYHADLSAHGFRQNARGIPYLHRSTGAQGARAATLVDRTEVLYVSPLKALGNDIQKNLEGPLSEILALAAERGMLMPEIRTAVRTGDTLAKERREMLKRPPHILVTTPESLYILLTADKSRAILRDVQTVIVDEIHAVADDKRGAHLSLSLERLDLLAEHPTRIGLSATQKPIELIAHFLDWRGAPCSGHREYRTSSQARPRG